MRLGPPGCRSALYSASLHPDDPQAAHRASSAARALASPGVASRMRMEPWAAAAAASVAAWCTAVAVTAAASAALWVALLADTGPAPLLHASVVRGGLGAARVVLHGGLCAGAKCEQGLELPGPRVLCRARKGGWWPQGVPASHLLSAAVLSAFVAYILL